MNTNLGYAQNVNINMDKDIPEIEKFIIENNAIEKIFREPFDVEVNEYKRFYSLQKITIDDLKKFVSVCQPGAKIRDKYFENVYIKHEDGSVFIAADGSPHLPYNLSIILESDLNPTFMHVAYEKLHPFTDCNGRSGRAIWAWQTRKMQSNFLINYYMQTLRDIQVET